MNTLISIVSRQIWPQVLAVLHYRPSRVHLLHSVHRVESQGPAERMRSFLLETGLVPAGGVSMGEISHNDFAEIEGQLDLAGIPPHEALLNFTGGNKLMATAAFRWAMRRGVLAAYMERENELLEFQQRDGDVTTKRTRLPPGLADDLDPLELLRCQYGEGDIASGGERLRLSRKAAALRPSERGAMIAKARGVAGVDGLDMSQWLERSSAKGDRPQNEGDGLEFTTAFALVDLGLPQVRRGIRLKSRTLPSETRDSAEFDLVFVRHNRLWLVDCKDTLSEEQLLNRLFKAFKISPPFTDQQKSVMGRVERKFHQSHKQVLKEDVMHIREIAGAMGRIVGVRRVLPDSEVQQFARDHGIDLVESSKLHQKLKQLLAP